MIMRDGEFANMIQHNEKDEPYILLDKEQRAMTSTPTGKALLLVQHVLSLHHFLQSSIPHNLVVASRVTTSPMDSMFIFVDHLVHLQTLFRVAEKMLLWT